MSPCCCWRRGRRASGHSAGSGTASPRWGGRSRSTYRALATPMASNGADRPGRRGGVPGRPDPRVGFGGAARGRTRRRHGRGAVPGREDPGARHQPDRRRRRCALPDRGRRRAQGHHRGAEPGRRARPGRQDQHRLRRRVGAASESEPEVHEDYVSAYDLGRFAESARFVRH